MNKIHFFAQGQGLSADYLSAPIEWQAGDWHEVTLTYLPDATALRDNGQVAARGAEVSVVFDKWTCEELEFSLGSDAVGSSFAQGEFDELITYYCAWEAEEVPA